MSKLRFASLTAGLLARKGEAEPSATPFADQLLTRVGTPAVDMRPMIPAPSPPKAPAPPPALSAAPAYTVFGRRPANEVHPVDAPPLPVPLEPVQLDDDEEHEHEHDFAGENRCVTCPGPLPDDAHRTYHVNLRLKRMRFIRLKLTAALLRRPVQDIVGEALDAWFDTIPPDVVGDCACLRTRDE